MIYILNIAEKFRKKNNRKKRTGIPPAIIYAITGQHNEIVCHNN
jgi:hypothetical protein